jgi:hypothetical protein
MFSLKATPELTKSGLRATHIVIPAILRENGVLDASVSDLNDLLAASAVNYDFGAAKVRFEGSNVLAFATLLNKWSDEAKTFVVTEVRTGGRVGPTVAKL